MNAEEKRVLVNRFLRANKAVREANLFLEDFLGVAKFNNSEKIAKVLSESSKVKDEIKAEGLEQYGKFDSYYQSWDSWVEILKEEIGIEE